VLASYFTPARAISAANVRSVLCGCPHVRAARSELGTRLDFDRHRNILDGEIVETDQLVAHPAVSSVCESRVDFDDAAENWNCVSKAPEDCIVMPRSP
jgi:hypothetical protein